MTFLNLFNKYSYIPKKMYGQLYELIFFHSKIVKNLTDFVVYRNNIIDFSYDQFSINVLKILKNIPINYITNQIIFMDMNLYIDKDIFIPRNDTEVVCEKFINVVKKTSYDNKIFLDLCTGSGCIALKLAKVFKNNKIYGSDINIKCINIANKNKCLLNLKNVNFMQANFLECLNIINEKIDYLICNPPYIDINDVNLETSVKLYEPNDALFASNKGLKFYLDFVDFVYTNNWFPEIVCFEFGFLQKFEINNIFKSLLTYYEFNFFKDKNNNDRGIILIKK